MPIDHRRALRRRLITPLAVATLLMAPALGTAQDTSAPQPAAPVTQPITAAAGIEASGQTAIVTLSNRPIATLRARILGRMPAERAAVTARSLDDLAGQRIDGPVVVRTIEGSNLISVGSRTVMVLTPLDVDAVADESLDEKTTRAVAAIRLAMAEAIEARTPALLVRSVLLSLLAMAVAFLLLVAIARGHSLIGRRLVAAAEERVGRAGAGSLEVLRASRVFDFWRGCVSLISLSLGVFVSYSALTFILRRFPYTRPWGESMRVFLLSTLSKLALDTAHAIPSLFTVLVIVVVTRFFVRLLQLFFKAVEQGRVDVAWLHPDTAQPTRRLASALLWLFAAVMAYPYLPGSDTDAFKGASVFIGLVVSLGSSGLVNQIMSSFMITYSRALHLGDYVRIGDVEGVVHHVGILSTKIKTEHAEEITIPNAVVVATMTTNYSRFADGLYRPTSVTIGYDTPWRQVQSLLLMAAERTAGVRKTPPPHVRQVELQDFYVKYTLLVCLDHAEKHVAVMSDLHANILDLFNEYGVQIMSPNYERDPEQLKIVPKEQWHAAPAPQEK